MIKTINSNNRLDLNHHLFTLYYKSKFKDPTNSMSTINTNNPFNRGNPFSIGESKPYTIYNSHTPIRSYSPQGALKENNFLKSSRLDHNNWKFGADNLNRNKLFQHFQRSDLHQRNRFEKQLVISSSVRQNNRSYRERQGQEHEREYDVNKLLENPFNRKYLCTAKSQNHLVESKVYVPQTSKYQIEGGSTSQIRIRTDHEQYNNGNGYAASDAHGYGSRLSHAASEQRIPTNDLYLGHVASYSRKSIEKSNQTPYNNVDSNKYINSAVNDYSLNLHPTQSRYSFENDDNSKVASYHHLRDSKERPSLSKISSHSSNVKFGRSQSDEKSQRSYYRDSPVKSPPKSRKSIEVQQPPKGPKQITIKGKPYYRQTIDP